MAINALKTATDPTSKDAIVLAASQAKFDSIVGPIDFTAPLVTPTGTGNSDFAPGPGHKTKNVYDHGLGAAQWLEQGGKYKFTEVPVNNASAPYLTADLLSAPKALPVAKS